MYEICSIPPKKETAQKKIAGLCRNIDWGLSKPCNSGKSNHHYFRKGSCIRLHDPLFSSVLVFVPQELVRGLLFSFSGGNTPQKQQHTHTRSRWKFPNDFPPKVLICVDNLLLFGKYGRSLREPRPSWMGNVEHFW